MAIDYNSIPVAESWYGIDAHPGGVVRLREIHLDPYWSGTVWLVQGEERNLVVDSGTGIVPLAPLISVVWPDKPSMAVALCGYYDHAGGFCGFDERACHPLEADALSGLAGSDLIQSLGTGHRLRALPSPDFRLEKFNLPGAAPTALLDDGDVIDLGGRKLDVLHIPGRTAGSLALWEAETGYLFGGETLFVDPEQRDFPPEDAGAYEHSLQRLGELPVNIVFGGHYGSFGVDELEQLIDKEIGRYS